MVALVNAGTQFGLAFAGFPVVSHRCAATTHEKDQ
jgi:hypothetical protein